MKRHLPNIITLANLSCGALAVMIGLIEISPYLICLGLILDVFDGLTARWLNAQGELGKQLDSLADLITFGVAPAYLYFLQAPSMEWYLYIGPLMFIVLGALRLGIFNTLPPSKEFVGLPIPAAAICVLGILFSLAANIEPVLSLLNNPIIYTAFPILLGLLMVSKFRLLSLKGLDKTTMIPFAIMLILAGIIALYSWQIALSAFVLIYILVSVVWRVIQRD